MAELKGTKAAPDDTGINTENVIEVGMEDLSEKDRNDLDLELQRELEEVMVEKQREKVSCFQKTRGGGDCQERQHHEGVHAVKLSIHS
jgi:hypothetical protein